MKRKSESIPVVIEVAADGFITVYGSGVDCRIVIRPWASTVKAGLLVDELIDEALPHRHRQIRCQRSIAATGQVRKLTPERLRSTVAVLQLSEAFQAINNPNLRPTPYRVLLARVLGATR